MEYVSPLVNATAILNGLVHCATFVMMAGQDPIASPVFLMLKSSVFICFVILYLLTLKDSLLFTLTIHGSNGHLSLTIMIKEFVPTVIRHFSFFIFYE